MFYRYPFVKNILDDEVLNLLDHYFNLFAKVTKGPLVQNFSDATKISAVASSDIEHYPKQALTTIENYAVILKDIKAHFKFIKINNNLLKQWNEKLFNEPTLFRTFDTEIVKAYKVPWLLEELIHWYHTSDQPKILKIIIFTIDFLMVKPFDNGNGHISRLLMNYFLIKEGYTFFRNVSLEKVIHENKDVYLKALKEIVPNWNSPNCNYLPLIKLFLKIFTNVLNNFLNQ